MDLKSVKISNLKEKFKKLAKLIVENCEGVTVDKLKMKTIHGTALEDNLSYYKFSNVVVHCIKDNAVRLDILDSKGTKLYGIPLGSRNDGRLITLTDKPVFDMPHETVALLSSLADDKTALLEMYILEKEMSSKILAMLGK